MSQHKKPVIGISCGDLNGIGIEVIIKSFSDGRILDHCTPVIFASNKVINFYKKTMPEYHFNYQSTIDLKRLNPKMVNVYSCWEEDINITPGELTNEGGMYAIKSLFAAANALKENEIDGLVTAPLHKKNIQSADFNYSGHTPFLKEYFKAPEVVMILFAAGFRMALVTEHLPVSEIASNINKQTVLNKLITLNQSLIRDFGISKPKIAVLGLNPHAGDEGLIGQEEETIIKPAIKEAKHNNIMAWGPYSADAFFSGHNHLKFDAVLAMYHDQGLIPFKSLSMGAGTNFSAGLKQVRTSPDHGTAFDIAGKNLADHSSFINAVYDCIDIRQRRIDFDEDRKNPLHKLTSIVLANVEDEKIEE